MGYLSICLIAAVQINWSNHSIDPTIHAQPEQVYINIMKAIVYTEFGPPDVLQLKEVEIPATSPDEVLIKVYAAAVSAEDPELRSSPGLNGLNKPRKQYLGHILPEKLKP